MIVPGLNVRQRKYSLKIIRSSVNAGRWSCRSYHRYVAIELGKTFCERLNSNKTTATSIHILRNGCYEVQPPGVRVAAQVGTAGRPRHPTRMGDCAAMVTASRVRAGEIPAINLTTINRSMRHSRQIDNSAFIMVILRTFVIDTPLIAQLYARSLTTTPDSLGAVGLTNVRGRSGFRAT